MNTLVAVGVVRMPHGIRGRLKVEPLTDDPTRFSELKSVYIEKPGGEPAAAEIVKVNFQPGCVLLELSGIKSREQAETYRNARLLIPEELVPPAGEDQYYYYQLEGLRVEAESGELLGTLDFVGRTGGNDVYFVTPPGGGEQLLVPALKHCIKRIDLNAGLMVVDKDWVV